MYVYIYIREHIIGPDWESLRAYSSRLRTYLHILVYT